MTKSFVHLHAHTEYSMLDGAAKIVDYLKKVKELNQPAAAITDHGNLYGAMEFVQKANDLGIKPIIGYEAYITPGSRFDKPDRENNKRYHLTLLAENNIGYQNLVELASKSYTEGYYYKPRIDYEILDQHHDGLIALSGCLGGELAQHLAPDGSVEEGNTSNERSFEKALEIAKKYQSIFGKENYFIEIHNHGIKQQLDILDDLVEISELIDAPLVAANDSHYVEKNGAEAHDALLCVQTNRTLDDETRFRFDGSGYYVKSAEEMRELFTEDKYPVKILDDFSKYYNSLIKYDYNLEENQKLNLIINIVYLQSYLKQKNFKYKFIDFGSIDYNFNLPIINELDKENIILIKNASYRRNHPEHPTEKQCIEISKQIYDNINR